MVEELKKEVRVKAFGYVSAALGLVAGLAWNDAIKAFIEAVFPLTKDTIFVKFMYALLVTLAVVILIKYLDKFINSSNDESTRA